MLEHRNHQYPPSTVAVYQSGLRRKIPVNSCTLRHDQPFP
jgi:hypothetical protein